MGRKGFNVEVRDGSIRLEFVISPGEPRVRRTLMRAGAPLPPTPANVKYAHRLAAEIREKIRAGVFSMAEYFPADGTVGGATTLATQLDRWLATQRLEASSLAGYSSAVRFWKAAPYDPKDPSRVLGDRALRALRRGDILTALAMRQELSGKTVNNYTSVLRQACDLAVVEDLLQENPVEGVQRAKWQRDPPDPFSRDEAELIIADCAKHYPEPIANLVEWRFFTGVRTSEMAGLRWARVDLAGGYVRISEAIVRGIDKGTTKTAVSRDVMLNSRAAGALQRQRKHTQMAADHVWLDPRYGTPWLEERAFRRSYWEPCLKRLGIRYRPPNNMRHTYATMMLMADRTSAWCAGQMGHSVEIFHRTYAKWLKGKQDDVEMQGLERWLSPLIPPQTNENAR